MITERYLWQVSNVAERVCDQVKLDASHCVTRKEMQEVLLDYFGIKWSDARTLRRALKALGVKPHSKLPRPGQRGGPVSYYRPVTVLALASAHHRMPSFLTSESDLLRPYRALTKHYANEPGDDPPHTDIRAQANAVIDLGGDIDFAAQLLLIGSPDLGMDPARRNDLVEEHLDLLGLLGDAWLMWCALGSWDRSYQMWASGRDYALPPRTLQQKRELAAFWFLEDFGKSLLEADSIAVHLASEDERDRE